MKTVGVAEIKARLSSYLKRVKAGQEIIITERGLPVAKVVPLERGEERSVRQERLIRAGILVPAKGKLPKWLLSLPEGAPAAGELVLEALLEERREGR